MGDRTIAEYPGRSGAWNQAGRSCLTRTVWTHPVWRSERVILMIFTLTALCHHAWLIKTLVIILDCQPLVIILRCQLLVIILGWQPLLITLDCHPCITLPWLPT